MKFWIGGAAQFANMTLLWANLIVDGKNYGPHGFAIQIRDNSNMRVLPGVIIGDCGAKYGYDGVGILFLILKKNRQWLDHFPEFQSPKRDPSQQDHGRQRGRGLHVTLRVQEQTVRGPIGSHQRGPNLPEHIRPLRNFRRARNRLQIRGCAPTIWPAKGTRGLYSELPRCPEQNVPNDCQAHCLLQGWKNYGQYLARKC
jgi:hypothetical protein